jgi:hypothetical protein
MLINQNVKRLIGIGQSTHAAHDAEDVVVNSVNADLGCLVTCNCVVRKD